MTSFRLVARPKGEGMWLNLYINCVGTWQAGGIYQTRRQADDIAKSHRADCVFVPVRSLRPARYPTR